MSTLKNVDLIMFAKSEASECTLYILIYISE